MKQAISLSNQATINDRRNPVVSKASLAWAKEESLGKTLLGSKQKTWSEGQIAAGLPGGALIPV